MTPTARSMASKSASHHSFCNTDEDAPAEASASACLGSQQPHKRSSVLIAGRCLPCQWFREAQLPARNLPEWQLLAEPAVNRALHVTQGLVPTIPSQHNRPTGLDCGLPALRCLHQPQHCFRPCIFWLMAQRSLAILDCLSELLACLVCRRPQQQRVCSHLCRWRV